MKSDTLPAEGALLGIDYGRVRLGLAKCDSLRLVVTPLRVLRIKDMRPALDAWLFALLNRAGPRPYTIAPVEQASLFGAAVAAVLE
jgi:hexokinase